VAFAVIGAAVQCWAKVVEISNGRKKGDLYTNIVKA
jgi:hypothetical protein